MDYLYSDSTYPGYAGGSSDSGSTWSQWTTWDFMFNVYGTTGGGGTYTASSILIDSQTNPTDVANAYPSISAIVYGMSADYINIQVGTTSGAHDMWNYTTSITPIASGQRCQDIIYAGTVLSFDETTYYVRVRFYSSQTLIYTSWSSVATFITTTTYQFNSVGSYTANADDFSSVYGAIWTFQTFVANASGTLNTISLRLFRQAPGGSMGTFTVSVRNVDAGHFPTGGDLTSDSMDADDIVSGTVYTDGQWYNFTISCVITTGIEYAIVIRAPSGCVNNPPGTGKIISWVMDITASAYEGYCRGSTDSGATWTTPIWSTYDFMFIAYADIQYATYDLIGTTNVEPSLTSVLYSRWNSPMGLLTWITCTNNTGSYANSTTYGFPGGSTYHAWANYTITMNSNIGKHVKWKVYVQTSNNEWTVTPWQTIVVGAAYPTFSGNSVSFTEAGIDSLFSITVSLIGTRYLS